MTNMQIETKGRTRAIHIISTTYGSWLPGDPSRPAGHWSPLFDTYGQVRKEGGQLNLPDEATFRIAREQMLEPPKTLSDDEQRTVANSFRHNVFDAGRARCQVIALAIEATHFHMLIGPLCSEDIGRFVGRLKGCASSAILEMITNQPGKRKRIWTRGYWKVFLFDEVSVSMVRKYVEKHNTRRGLPANPYADWVG